VRPRADSRLTHGCQALRRADNRVVRQFIHNPRDRGFLR
jgi:hypothetical protein